MDAIFWFPIGAVILGVLIGARMGGNSTDISAAGGAAVGAFLALMATMPLLALGLSNL